MSIDDHSIPRSSLLYDEFKNLLRSVPQNSAGITPTYSVVRKVSSEEFDISFEVSEFLIQIAKNLNSEYIQNLKLVALSPGSEFEISFEHGAFTLEDLRRLCRVQGVYFIQSQLLFILKQIIFAGSLLEDSMCYHPDISPYSLILMLENTSKGLRLESFRLTNPLSGETFLRELTLQLRSILDSIGPHMLRIENIWNSNFRGVFLQKHQGPNLNILKSVHEQTLNKSRHQSFKWCVLVAALACKTELLWNRVLSEEWPSHDLIQSINQELTLFPELKKALEPIITEKSESKWPTFCMLKDWIINGESNNFENESPNSFELAFKGTHHVIKKASDFIIDVTYVPKRSGNKAFNEGFVTSLDEVGPFSELLASEVSKVSEMKDIKEALTNTKDKIDQKSEDCEVASTLRIENNQIADQINNKNEEIIKLSQVASEERDSNIEGSLAILKAKVDRNSRQINNSFAIELQNPSKSEIETFILSNVVQKSNEGIKIDSKEIQKRDFMSSFHNDNETKEQFKKPKSTNTNKAVSISIKEKLSPSLKGSIKESQIARDITSDKNNEKFSQLFSEKFNQSKNQFKSSIEPSSSKIESQNIGSVEKGNENTYSEKQPTPPKSGSPPLIVAPKKQFFTFPAQISKSLYKSSEILSDNNCEDSSQISLNPLRPSFRSFSNHLQESNKTYQDNQTSLPFRSQLRDSENTHQVQNTSIQAQEESAYNIDIYNDLQRQTSRFEKTELSLSHRISDFQHKLEKIANKSKYTNMIRETQNRNQNESLQCSRSYNDHYLFNKDLYDNPAYLSHGRYCYPVYSSNNISAASYRSDINSHYDNHLNMSSHKYDRQSEDKLSEFQTRFSDLKEYALSKSNYFKSDTSEKGLIGQNYDNFFKDKPVLQHRCWIPVKDTQVTYKYDPSLMSHHTHYECPLSMSKLNVQEASKISNFKDNLVVDYPRNYSMVKGLRRLSPKIIRSTIASNYSHLQNTSIQHNQLEKVIYFPNIQTTDKEIVSKDLSSIVNSCPWLEYDVQNHPQEYSKPPKKKC